MLTCIQALDNRTENDKYRKMTCLFKPSGERGTLSLAVLIMLKEEIQNGQQVLIYEVLS